MFRPNSAIFRLEYSVRGKIICLTDNFSSDTVFQPEDGRIRPKHVVGKLLYLQI